MHRINKVSRWFSWLFKAFFLFYPVLVILAWIGYPDIFGVVIHPPIDVDWNSLKKMIKIYVCLIDLIPITLTMLSFYYLAKLFKLYEKNFVFEFKNIRCIKKIGYVFFFKVLAQFFINPLVSYILTLDAPVGKRMVVFAFDGRDTSNLVVGGIIILISWIMEEARRIKEEQSYTI